MEKEQEQIQFMGFIGILKESIKIISSRPNLFAKIALFCILPLNFFTLVSLATFKLILNEIHNYSSTSNDHIDLYFSRFIKLYLVQAISLILAFKYSLLSTSTVVYSASCIFTSEEITFQKALTVALKVRKKLAFTMVCQFLLTNAYTFVTTIIIFFLSKFGGITFGLFPSKQNDLQFEIITVILIIILLVFGIILALYMTISWQLANIITVMDDYSGFKAMKKSKQLIKGNYGTAIALLLVLSICCSPMFILAKQLVGIDINFGVGPIILYGIISLVFNPMIMLFCMVVQTMFYFVCKAYHHESIDISSVIDCLDLSKSDEEYFPLKSESKKIDQLDV